MIDGAIVQARANVAEAIEAAAGVEAKMRALGGALAALDQQLRALAGALQDDAETAPVAGVGKSGENDTNQKTEDGAAGTKDTDVDGARLIALNMALGGDSREKTNEYLAEHFDLPDRKGLIEEVYAAIEN